MYVGIDNFVSAFSPLLILSDGTTFKKKDIGTLTSEAKSSHFIHLSANTAAPPPFLLDDFKRPACQRLKKLSICI